MKADEPVERIVLLISDAAGNQKRGKLIASFLDLYVTHRLPGPFAVLLIDLAGSRADSLEVARDGHLRLLSLTTSAEQMKNKAWALF